MKSTKRYKIFFFIELAVHLFYVSFVFFAFFRTYQMPISSIFSLKEYFFLCGGFFSAGLFTYRFILESWKDFKDLFTGVNT